MGLLQNGFRDAVGVFRFYGATASNGALPQQLGGNYARTGMRRNLTAGEGITSEQVGVPPGCVHPIAWQMPQKPGLVSARAYDQGVTAQATGLMGLPATGGLTIRINPNDPHCDLISWGVGSSIIAVVSVDTLINANVKGIGTASLLLLPSATAFPLNDSPPARTAEASITSSGSATAFPLDDSSPLRTAESYIGTPTSAHLGAEASIEGSDSFAIEAQATPRPLGVETSPSTALAEISVLTGTPTALPTNTNIPICAGDSSCYVTGLAVAWPLDDTPPERTATAQFSFTGSFVPYALGHMVGAALPYTELSPQALADAVWSTLAEQYTETGTMGKKINDGGAGGLTTEQEAWLQQAALEASAARKVSINKAVITVSMSGGRLVTIYDDDGTTPIASFELDSEGTTRVPV